MYEVCKIALHHGLFKSLWYYFSLLYITLPTPSLLSPLVFSLLFPLSRVLHLQFLSITLVSVATSGYVLKSKDSELGSE